MTALPNLVAHITPIAERYLMLLRVHPTKRYNYAKRGYFNLPVIEVDQHGPKCKKGESWLYFAVPANACLTILAPPEHLYVGAQTQDRMFRGDELDGNNYHHAEMRSGNGNDNPLAFLEAGQQIIIYRANAYQIQALISESQRLNSLRVLAEQPRTPKKHLGRWYEQYVLHSDHGLWRWNTAAANKSLAKLLLP